MSGRWGVGALLLALLSGCEKPCGEVPRDALVTATNVPTVLKATWTTRGKERGRVSYTDGSGRTRVTPWDQGGSTHEALLLGVAPGATVSWSIESEGETCGMTGEVAAPGLPTELPELEVSGEPRDHWSILPMISTERAWILMLDEEGQPIWAWQDVVPSGGLPPTVFRSRLAGDGDALLFMYQAVGADEIGIIGRLSLTGERESELRVTGIHTDFVQLPSGDIATLAWEIRSFEDGNRRLQGDKVLLISPSGEVRTLWNIFDHFEPDLSVTWNTNFTPNDPGLEDWSHLNGISYDPDSGDLLVSSTFSNGVMRIDAESGELVWALGDPGDITAPGESVSWPHSAQVIGDDQILVFNRMDPRVGVSCSNFTELDVDPEAGVATPTRVWESPDCLYTPYLGEARRLDDGTTVVNWCSAGRVDEVDLDGEIDWQVSVRAGYAFTFGDTIAPLR